MAIRKGLKIAAGAVLLAVVIWGVLAMPGFLNVRRCPSAQGWLCTQSEENPAGRRCIIMSSEQQAIYKTFTNVSHFIMCLLSLINNQKTYKCTGSIMRSNLGCFYVSNYITYVRIRGGR